MSRSTVLKGAGIVLLGFLGMGCFQCGAMLYQDWRFLHGARVMAEQQAIINAAKPKPEATRAGP